MGRAPRRSPRLRGRAAAAGAAQGEPSTPRAAAGGKRRRGQAQGARAKGAKGVAAGPEPAAWASHPMKAREQALKKRGFATVAGVDEAGRGPLAGGPTPRRRSLRYRDALSPMKNGMTYCTLSSRPLGSYPRRLFMAQ